MSDRLDFSIDGVRRQVEVMRESNAQNEKNKESFIEYVDSTLSPEWNTKEGQVAVTELKNFANKNYADYIRYLNDKIDALENVIIPALERINNA